MKTIKKKESAQDRFSYQLCCEILLWLSMGCFCYHYYLQQTKDYPADPEPQVIFLLSLKSHICYLQYSGPNYLTENQAIVKIWKTKNDDTKHG